MKTSIAHQHTLCQDYTRELAFYKTELSFFKARLGETASKNTALDFRAQAEHFENKFRIIDLHCDELLHDINLLETNLMAMAANKPTYINIKMIENDENLEELMAFTSSDYASTKMEFNKFLAKYL